MDDPETRALTNYGHQKYSAGVMLFGAITAEGLIPREKPIYFTDYLLRNVKKLTKK